MVVDTVKVAQAPLWSSARLSSLLGIDLIVQRDDLLPFPLAGNKFRKILAELRGLRFDPDVLVTNGAIDSNHCRTVAMIAAELGIRARLVLHSEYEQSASPALAILSQLGAEFTVVRPDRIRSTIEKYRVSAERAGRSVHVIAGGCHTPSGARAYRDVGTLVLRECQPNYVFVASGTGATQGGLVAAASQVDRPVQVFGVSVARRGSRGRGAVAEAAGWAGDTNPKIDFIEDYIAGGYGVSDARTLSAVELGWAHGLPLDVTYTGKAFAALLDYARTVRMKGSRVLFWHTGGLWNHLKHIGGSVPGDLKDRIVSS